MPLTTLVASQNTMKLIWQITLGVFLGTIAAQLVIDVWHTHQATLAQQAAEKQLAEQEKVRDEQASRIRALLLESRKVTETNQSNTANHFVPEDAQAEMLKKK